ncbi:DUF1109 domain-containing protein [Rhizobium deserti]|uniref:DUF1109 domain-containing protein n=2 Tax=Rhizobium deserti TaxID=2547961 RepID=A0A4R5UBN0_9HYPH|nr:DUF1109 domain-containing protein [Rhizobium deserti]
MLIKGLATQAGKRRAVRPRFDAVLAAALLVSFLAATAIVLLTAGTRPDLMVIISTWTFQFKVVGMILIAVGTVLVARHIVQPGVPVHLLHGLGPGVAFLLLGSLFDRSGFPLLGAHTYSVPACAGVIILSSIPALGAILAAMRAGTPTHLAQAGAVAGLLAGSVGALSYTIACLNDGASFVALWYLVSIGIVAVIGAITGRIALRW